MQKTIVCIVLVKGKNQLIRQRLKQFIVLYYNPLLKLTSLSISVISWSVCSSDKPYLDLCMLFDLVTLVACRLLWKENQLNNFPYSLFINFAV